LKSFFFCFLILFLFVFSGSAFAFSPPLMFQNDRVFEEGYEHPILEKSGTIFAPYTFFLGFSDMIKKDFDGGFLIENKKTGAFISYNFSSPDRYLTSRFMSKKAEIFEGTVYFPLNESASLFSLVSEIKKDGNSTFVRLSDHGARSSFSQLLDLIKVRG